MATYVGKVSDIGFSRCWLFLGLPFLFLDAPELMQPPQHNGHLTQQQHSYLRQCNLHLHYVPGTVISGNVAYTYTMYLAQLPKAMQLAPTLCTWYSNSTATLGNATYTYTMYMVQQQHSYLRQCNLYLHYVPGTATVQLPQAMPLCTVTMHLTQQEHSYLRQCSLHLQYVLGTAITRGPLAAQLCHYTGN